MIKLDNNSCDEKVISLMLFSFYNLTEVIALPPLNFTLISYFRPDGGLKVSIIPLLSNS
jgi:hypothetical protein